MRNEIFRLFCLLVALGLCGCGGKTPKDKFESSPQAGPAGPAEISEADVSLYVDWYNEFHATLSDEADSAEKLVHQDNMQAYNDHLKSTGAKVRSYQARKPFRGTVKEDALDELVQCFFASQRYFRDEQQLEVLKQKFGSLIETGASHESAWRKLHFGGKT